MNERDVRSTAAVEARGWSVAVAVLHVLFVVAWVVAAAWQGPRYDPVAHTISDMYAVDAPHGWFLVVLLTLCGVAVIGFALRAVWPALRAAGWSATVGSILLALSIFGLGDLLTPFEREACRLADPGCSSADQVANVGGTLDGILSTLGVVCLIAAGFFLAAAMSKLPRWQRGALAGNAVSTALIVLSIGIAVLPDQAGLMERLLAAVGAGGIVALGVAVLRSSRAEPAQTSNETPWASGSSVE